MTQTNMIGIFQGAIAGGLAAAFINLALYFAGNAMGAEYLITHPSSGALEPLPIMMPVFGSVLPAMGAAFTLTSMIKVFGERAWFFFTIFTGLTVLLTLRFCFGLFHTSESISAITLCAMVVIGTALTVGGMYRWGRQPGTKGQ